MWLSDSTPTRTNMLTARALSRTVSRSAALLSHSKPANASTKLCISSKARLSSYRSPRNLALALYKPGTSALVRYASSSSNPPGVEDIDAKREEKIGQKVMRAHPERVSSESTTHPPFHEIVDNNAEKEVDMMAGIRHDLVRQYRSSIACNLANVSTIVALTLHTSSFIDLSLIWST